MKRDMDLVRRILLEVEKRSPEEMDRPLQFEGHSDQEITYHVRILHEAGLITALDFSSSGGEQWQPVSLTWEGHDFLDASRDDSQWSKARAIIKEKAGTVSFAVLKALLVSLARKAVGL